MIRACGDQSKQQGQGSAARGNDFSSNHFHMLETVLGIASISSWYKDIKHEAYVQQKMTFDCFMNFK